jgi:serine/threonine protein kinase
MLSSSDTNTPDKPILPSDHLGARPKIQPLNPTVVSASQPQQTSSQLGILSSHLQHPSTQYTTSSGGAVLQTLRDPSHYEELSVIGNGAYGTVYRARDRATDTIVALKKMRFSLTEDGVPMAILREISLLKQLEKFDHPNIVRLMDICHGQRREREMSLYLVFEHVHQDLASYLEKCPSPG